MAARPSGSVGRGGPRYDGMIHGFSWMLGALETAQVLHDDIAEAAVPVLTPVAAA